MYIPAGFLLTLQSTSASRFYETTLEGGKDYQVHLLVTRHGLSCTNIVEKWGNSLDFGRSGMLDPLLGGLGEYGSKEMGKQTANWLSKKQLRIDSVVSSNLGRAIQTALLMYPGTSPLYIVPHIREHANGASNSPKPPDEQVDAIAEAINTTFQLNYEWLRVFGDKPGTWRDFEFFLQHSFLPSLVNHLDKKAGSDIVIPVVTHSMFMRESIGNLCGQFWGDRGYSKPLNNQVIHLTYNFTIRSAPPGSHDATPMHYFQLAAPCEQVAEGMSAMQSNSRVCMSDIGDTCSALIKRYAYSGNRVWDRTVESDMVIMTKRIANLEDSLSNLGQKLDLKTDLFAAANLRGRVSCIMTWGGSCSPSSMCHYKASEISCVPKATYDADRLRQDIQKLSIRSQQVKHELNFSTTQLADWEAMRCRGGGNPNIHWYLKTSR